MEQTPKKRGRPAKDKTKSQPDKVEVVYNHVRYQRCNRISRSPAHPQFLQRQCGGLMTAVKTTDKGRFKHYKCPLCGEIRKVEGDKV